MSRAGLRPYPRLKDSPERHLSFLGGTSWSRCMETEAKSPRPCSASRRCSPSRPAGARRAHDQQSQARRRRQPGRYPGLHHGPEVGPGDRLQGHLRNDRRRPDQVTYAVQPPKDVAFSQTATGARGTGNLNLISNGRRVRVQPASASSGWTCQKLNQVEAIAQNQLVGSTPRRTGSRSSDLLLRRRRRRRQGDDLQHDRQRLPMKCLDSRAKGIKGISTICTTKQNILGYVKVAGEATSSRSPATRPRRRRRSSSFRPREDH